MSDKTHDLDMPAGLTAPGRRAYEIIAAYLKERGFSDNGTCKAFYSPAAWAAREEAYGAKSQLIVVYDGGAIAPVFSMDMAYDFDCAVYEETGETRAPYQLYEGLHKTLRAAGFYFEECTRWYSAVYLTDSADSEAENAA